MAVEAYSKLKLLRIFSSPTPSGDIFTTLEVHVCFKVLNKEKINQKGLNVVKNYKDGEHPL